MKNVVITGSARGLGFEMAKVFLENNNNVMISDLSQEKLESAKEELNRINSMAKVEYKVCDVTNSGDVSSLIDYANEKFGGIDIWINNAGVNQPDKAIWDLSEKEIDMIIDVDLRGTIICSKLIMEYMSKVNKGAIYNVEGYGSNDAKMLGLSIYGTSKRAVTYFTEALALESEVKNTGVIVGKLSPGIMITDFLVNSFRNKKMHLSDKNKKIYNILGDYPDVVAKYLVNKMIENTNNNIRINWLTTRRAMFKFIKATFIKRDLFKRDK